MNIIDYVFPKQCLLCSRIGFDICSNCLKSLKHTLPSCCICKKINNGYWTHDMCLDTPIQCLNGWYLTSDISKKLKQRKILEIYSIYISLIHILIEYLSINSLLENSTILPLFNQNSKDFKLNIFLAKTTRRNKDSKKDILLIGEYLEDFSKVLKQIEGLCVTEPYKVRILTIFENINPPPQQPLPLNSQHPL